MIKGKGREVMNGAHAFEGPSSEDAAHRSLTYQRSFHTTHSSSQAYAFSLQLLSTYRLYTHLSLSPTSPQVPLNQPRTLPPPTFNILPKPTCQSSTKTIIFRQLAYLPPSALFRLALPIRNTSILISTGCLAFPHLITLRHLAITLTSQSSVQRSPQHARQDRRTSPILPRPPPPPQFSHHQRNADSSSPRRKLPSRKVSSRKFARNSRSTRRGGESRFRSR